MRPSGGRRLCGAAENIWSFSEECVDQTQKSTFFYLAHGNTISQTVLIRSLITYLLETHARTNVFDLMTLIQTWCSKFKNNR